MPPENGPDSFRRRVALFRRPPASFLATAFLSTAVLVPASALAAPKDAAALKLDQAAIETDYLATKFGDAEKKLNQALALCGANNCSPKVLAQLHCDLGVVYFVGAKKTDEAKAQFAEALKADPTAAIAKALTSPEIEQVFAAAKGGAAAPVTAPQVLAPRERRPTKSPTRPPPSKRSIRRFRFLRRAPRQHEPGQGSGALPPLRRNRVEVHRPEAPQDGLRR